MSNALPPLLHPIDAAAGRLSLSASSIWRLIRTGRLRTVKILGRTLVPESELQRLAQPADGDPWRTTLPSAINAASEGDSKSDYEAEMPMVRGSYKYL